MSVSTHETLGNLNIDEILENLNTFLSVPIISVFFPVTFFGLPVTLFEKVPVILKKCS